MFGIDLENFNYRLFLRTRKYLVFAVVAVFLSIITLLLVLIPQIGRVFSLYQELNSEKAAIIKLRQKVQALEAIDTDPVYQNQNQITKVLPSRKAVFELLASLKFIADSGSVNLRDIDLNPGLLTGENGEVIKQPTTAVNKQKIPGVERMVIKLNVEGTRDNINKFLDQISLIVPLTSITQMKLQAAAGTNLDFDTKDFESEVELTSYFFNKSITVSVDSPLPQVGAEENNVLSQINSFLSPQFVRPQNITGGGVQDLFGEDTLIINY